MGKTYMHPLLCLIDKRKHDWLLVLMLEVPGLWDPYQDGNPNLRSLRRNSLWPFWRPSKL